MYENAAAVVERAWHVLRVRPSGLFSDIDGTLSPIVERSEDARVDPRARAALAVLAKRLDLVAVVTGRNAADARRMLGLDGLVYVGNHGLEIDDQVVPEARPWVDRLEATLREVQTQLSLPGVRIENKRLTASVHYREAPDQAAACRVVLQALEKHAASAGLRVEPGRLVFNILPPLKLNKGTAVDSLARERALKGIVYIGDDVTDTHVFRALETLSAERGGLRTLSIGVVGEETQARVRETADVALPSVTAVADVLCGLLEQPRASGSMQSGSTEHTPE